ncbi:hypothetical protein LMG28614_05677 [Paraburkholderia ultramafica]|uniref:Bacteriophage T5 Orf172 DNA-binding domain-containing protein n=1 Tax=Paraburkholderia ultramafica TaxID=1544867 RepID=A0A6S7D0H4_9BURK|nr:GIY-YIG nuclease family protein [Paraburkholderia ultramafica]CAB3802704.1 hypothetical protein LMG28614_05677 [Paraburkholderia ultramafica]
MAEMDDDELLDALGVEVAPLKTSSHTPREERIIAGFEEILRFYETHGRAPQHGEDRDIFERLYAVRLEQLRRLPEAQTLLANLDEPRLLSTASSTAVKVEELDEDALLAELGVSDEPAEDDITTLRNVRPYETRRVAEEIATRTRCEDFEKFQPLFEKVKRELKAGERKVIRLETRSLDEIQQGTFFIVGGQTAYIAEEKGEFTTEYDRRDMRLRVIYDNETESEVLQRSLQRALHRDKVARLITEPSIGPLFGDVPEPDDIASGTIYVLRSESEHPFVKEHRELIHKIGVTGGKVEARIAGADKDATYLLANVEVVAEYKLHNINRSKMENLFHRLFGAAQIDLTIKDRFGHPVKPKEWFLVPLQVIDEVVKRIVDGSITGVVYDPKSAKLVPTTA